MNQINKFYLTEFLKTQNYFLPVMILFLQFRTLDYTQIFILFSVQSATVFLLEVPSGILADVVGKKKALFISRISVVPAYLIFAFFHGFGWYVPAMVLLGVNKAFKSGTHKAYIYEFLRQSRPDLMPTEIFGKCKFWARMGEAVASVTGGILAAGLGYRAVFMAAVIPAVMNVLNNMTYIPLSEPYRGKKLGFSHHSGHIIRSLREIASNVLIIRLILTEAVFVFCAESVEKFFQPYMKSAGIDVEYFGIIYMVLMLLSAFASRYASLLELRFSRLRLIDNLGLYASLPVMGLCLPGVGSWGLVSFALIFMVKNLRRPVLVSELNERISSENRATILSVSALTKSLIQVVCFPLIGGVSDHISMEASFLILSVIIALAAFVFRLGKRG